MINFTTATNGKTTKTRKNPTSTRSRLNMLKLLSVFALVILGVNGVIAQSYTSTAATGAWNTSRWNNTADAAPYTSAYTANANVSFTSGTYNFAGMGSALNVGNVTVASGVTVNFTSIGSTFATGGNVRTFNIGSGGLFDFNGQALSTAAGTGFIKSGTGVLGTGGGAFTGGFTLNAGTVVARGTTGMGSGGSNTLTLNGGAIAANNSRDFATTRFPGGITIGGNVQFGELSTVVSIAGSSTNLSFANNVSLGVGVRTFTQGNNGTNTFSGVISNTSGGLTFAANANTDGRFEITNAANTFTGDINVNGGEVRFTTDGSIGNAANDIIIDGGRFSKASDATTVTLGGGRDIQVGDGAGTGISSPGSGTLIYNNAITDKSSETGAWAKQGGGTLELGGASTYTGSTSINNGIVRLTTGNDRLPTGTVLSLGQAASANLGTFDLNGRNQTIGGLNSTTGTNATASNNTITSASAATLTVNGAGSYGDGTDANSGIISGAISLVKSGSGILTLGDVNTYTGTTSINNGTIQLTAGNDRLPTGADLSLGQASSANLGTFDLNGRNQTIAGLNSTSGTNATASNNTITSASAATLTVTGAGNYGDGTDANSGIIAGSISLVKSGAGTLTLGDANTYTGSTTVSAGTLQFNRTGGTTIPATNNVTISGGTLKISTNQTLNDVTLTSGTLMVDEGVTLTINGSFTGGGTIENNGTIVLVGPSSFPGSGTTISAMDTLTIDRGGNVTLDQSITITGNLTLTNGKLITGACNAATSNIALTLADNATITGASASRFVDGILKKTGDDAFTFPIGSGAKYAPVSITAPSVNTDRFAACYTGSNPNSSYSITAKAGSLNNVSKMEFWHINREAGASSANVTLSWDTIARSGPVRDMSQLRVCHWNGSQWDDLSNTGTTGSNASGTVTSGSVSSFSPFTLGSSGSSNPLPVTWAYFTAQKTDGGNQLNWGTASEKKYQSF
jgi:fibronectin-binding autotransporter adhesin